MERRILLILAIVFCTTVMMDAQTAGDYRSIATGNWGDATTWEIYNGSSWEGAVSVPTGSSGVITVQSGNTVTVDIAVSLSGSCYLKNQGVITIGDGSLTFGNGATYEHAINGGTIPTSTWNSGSTCLITGTTGTSAPTGLNQSFYNFTWNCPGQSGNLSLNSNLTTVNGNLTVTSTGSTSNQLRLGSGTFTVNIGGSIIINGANALFTSTGSATYTITVNVAGDINLSAGTFYLENAGTGTANWNVGGDFIMSGGILGRQGSGVGNINFVSGQHTFSRTGGTINSNNGGPIFNIESGATLDLGTSVINEGPFTLNSGATLICGHANGLNGNLTTTRTKTMSTGANYTFNGNNGQVTGTLLPAIVNNLTINNGSTTLTNAVTVSGTFTLSANNFSLTSSNPNLTAGIFSVSKTMPDNDGSDLAAALDDAGYSVGKRSNQYWALSHPGISSSYDLSLDGTTQGGITNASELRVIHSEDGLSFDLVGTHANGSGTVANRTGISGSTVGRFYLGGKDVSVNPLPVELTFFTASAKGKNIELRWNTATEVNNHGFEVERNINGNEWSKIGFVKGNGTTNTPQSYSFSDNISTPAKYQYRLKQIDRDGKFEYSTPVEAIVALTADDYKLSQNYPNPFNPSTTINFAVKNAERTSVKIYNLIGQEIATLFDAVAQPNQLYSLTFNAKDLPSGIYFYSLRSSSRNEVKRMMLLK